MHYLLKHKDIDVAALSFSLKGDFENLVEVHNSLHVPVGWVNEEGKINSKTVQGWWDGRGIPGSREGFREVLAQCDKRSKNELLITSFGLSLTDHYWVYPENKPLSWEKANFYDNDFSSDIGDLFFNRGKGKKGYDEKSPVNSSDGQLRKRWEIEKDTEKRVLVKEGVLPYCQEPFNEKLAAYICSKFGIPFVDYRVKKEGDSYIGECDNMTDTKTELVYASRIYDVFAKKINNSMIEHYVSSCKKLCGIDVQDNINRMLVLDYIINNQDRHWNNFGMIRESSTLQYTGIAPVFDSENSLWKRLSENLIRPLVPAGTKCCGKNVSDALNYVTDFSWYTSDLLQNIGDVAFLCLGDNANINHERRMKISEGIGLRVKELERIIDMRS
ncbi:hypothetical protein AGMMS4952_09250 [Spirochaetia bacterium]|nr:hypothetical protein AGMMS4952_09250 [Spirochaetia bacterium]